MSETLHIICPHCEAVNRIPTARLGERPKCGKCHQPDTFKHRFMTGG